MYTLLVEYLGYDLDRDKIIQKIAKVQPIEDGYGLGIRDRVFKFKNKKSALKTYSKLKKISGLQLKLIDESNDDYFVIKEN